VIRKTCVCIGGGDQLRPVPCKCKSYALFRTITRKVSLFSFLVVNWLWKYCVQRTECVFLAASYVKTHPTVNAAINFTENFLELIYLASQWQKYKNINLPNRIGVGDEEEKTQNMTKENWRCNWVFLQKKPKKISDTSGAQLAGHWEMFTQQQRLLKLPTMWLPFRHSLILGYVSATGCWDPWMMTFLNGKWYFFSEEARRYWSGMSTKQLLLEFENPCQLHEHPLHEIRDANSCTTTPQVYIIVLRNFVVSTRSVW